MKNRITNHSQTTESFRCDSHTCDYQLQGCVGEDLTYHLNLQFQAKRTTDLEILVSPLEPGFTYSFSVLSKKKFGYIEGGIFCL